MRIYYAEPTYPRGYSAPYGKPDTIGMPKDGSMGDLTCGYVANLSDKSVFANKSDEYVAFESAREACSNSDYEKVLAEVSKLENSTVGNAGPLLNMMRKVLISLREKEAESIFEDMDKIDDSLEPDDDDLAEGRRVGMDKSDAKKAVQKFANLAAKLDRTILRPSIKELKNLLEKLEDATGDARVKIDDRIEELNKIIAQFSDKKDEFINVQKAMQLYGILDNAEQIEEIRLVSQHFGQVYAGDKDADRGKPKSIEKANKAINKDLKKYKRETIGAWREEKAIRNGSKVPMLAAKRRRDARYERMNKSYSSYQDTEKRDYKRYCGSNFFGGQKNPVRCKYHMAGYERRQQTYLRSRARDLKDVTSGTTRLNNLNSLYASEQRRIASARGADNPFDFSSGFNYSDPLGLYGDTSSAGSFDASLFGGANMGGDAMFNLGGNNYQQMLMMGGQGPNNRAPMYQQQSGFNFGF